MAEGLAASVAALQMYLPYASTSNNANLPGWFIGDPSTNGIDSARQAFEDGVKGFRADVSAEECAKWLNSSNTIFDVEQVVISAKQKYEKKSPKSRARKWLASCSSRLMYYSVIMDTISQHHPEYVSLAWGAIKFLFIAVLNHEELLTEIAKAVAKIANLLPRADLSASLYPSQRMKVAVAQLYAKVMHFVQHAVKWYSKGKLAHSVSSVFKPYGLSFKPIIDDISEASRRVDQEAAAASRAEIRELHIKIQEFTRLTTTHFATQSQTTSNMTDQLVNQTTMLCQQKMSQITSLPVCAQLPSAEEAIDYSRSIKKRRIMYLFIGSTHISKLQEWYQNPNTLPILIARCRGPQHIARDFSVEILDTMRPSGIPTIWVLPHNAAGLNEALSLKDILVWLSLQALMLNPKALTEGINPVSSHHFQQILNLDQAFTLLGRCLLGLPKFYIILDLDLVQTAVNHRSTYTNSFIRDFLKLLLQQTESCNKLIITTGILNDSFGLEQDVLDEWQISVTGRLHGPFRGKGGGRKTIRYSSHVLPRMSGSQKMLNCSPRGSSDPKD